METTVNNTQIKKTVTVNPIAVSRVYKSDFQKEGTLTAELKQTIKTVSLYPTKSVSNSLSANIFDMKDFGFEEKPYELIETRVAWIDVPVGSTVESVMDKLKSVPNATLYRIMSNRPILADSDKYAIDNPNLQVTIDDYANKQAVRYGENHPDAGKLVLDANGKIQYRRIAFSLSKVDDIDSRTSDPADFYASPELYAELNQVVHVISEQKL